MGLTTPIHDLLSGPMGLQGGESLVGPRYRNSPTGLQSLRFGQKIDGIPVEGAYLTIRYRAESGQSRILSNLVIDEALPRDPAVSAQKAIGIAYESVDKNPEDFDWSTPNLIFKNTRKGGVLSWEVKVVNPDEAYSSKNRLVYVDAMTGAILSEKSLVKSALYREVHQYLDDGSGQYVELISDSDPATSDPHASSTYHNAVVVSDFISQEFNRSSFHLENYSCPGSEPNCVAHSNNIVLILDDSFSGAYFNASLGTVNLGSGDPSSDISPMGKSLHVVAHEMAHAMTRFSGADEAGAIDESFSDIFSVLAYVEENGLSTQSWHIGHEVFSPNDSNVALRYLNEPSLASDPHADDYEDLVGTPHQDSTVNSLAFYLLSQGGTHPRSSVSTNYVSGVGLGKAGVILYSALADELEGSNSVSFTAARKAMEDAALDEFGVSEAESVSDAYDAVNVPGSSAAVPESPSSISATSSSCFGYHSVSWSSSAGAESYVLKFSQNGSFSSGQTMYSGSATSAFVDIPSNGQLAVQACNDSGCSGFTATGNLFRLNYCH
jgi:Zn-dependent metalloprotease